MALVKLEKNEFEKLDDKDKKAAELAWNTAENLCAYFQKIAEKGTYKGIKEPSKTMSAPEKKTLRAIRASSLSFVASEEKNTFKKTVCRLAATYNKLAAGSDGRAAGTMAYKLMLATQMNYFHDNADKVAIFNIKSKADGEKLLQKMERLHKSLGATTPPVDRHFDESYQSFKQWAPEVIARIK